MTQHGKSPAPESKGQTETLALFVSDIHLQEAMPRTAEAFLGFLRHRAPHAQELYLLGDLFEYWAGDDDIPEPFNRKIVEALRELTTAGVAVHWIAGNRDFLVGAAFAESAGLTLLSDPHVATFAGKRIALAHGDAQCTDDTGYMAFRTQVRQPAWQQGFLAMPLEKRKAIIAEMRSGSREAQRGKSYEIMDVNADAIDALFARTGAQILIHGHTHRPARHILRDGRLRYVLPDWDCDAATPRGGWIALGRDGAITRHGLDGEEIA
ncbi:MAG TPA: UDP-2,3-diacylglucosamine diphosphatase [Paucimonas sp.]|nr:UDP-2,3-diacylglucosamine diphosphatase [Paucimonas sp.]